jgi:hypothetical protein
VSGSETLPAIKSSLLRPKARSRYPCALLSPNIGDEFLQYLKGIRDSATPEHLKIVSEIYGHDPLRPPQSIYGVGKKEGKGLSSTANLLLVVQQAG